MESPPRLPLLEYVRRPDVPKEVRLLAARGLLAPSATEQLALLVSLLADAEPEIAGTAAGTLAALPRKLVAEHLRQHPDPDLRTFFDTFGSVHDARRLEIAAERTGVGMSTGTSGDGPLDRVDADPEPPGGQGASSAAAARPRGGPVSALKVPQRVKLALQGSREQRMQLVRDPNDTVARAVLSSPKLTESEVESFARMTNVSDEVLRLIGRNRTWTRNYLVASSLVRNPRTPVTVSLSLLPRLTEVDVKRLAADRSVSEPVRMAARKLKARREGQREQ